MHKLPRHKTIRVFDNNNNLSNLTVSTGSLSPSFSANTTNYTVNVAGNVSAITIGASASSSKATLSGTYCHSYVYNKMEKYYRSYCVTIYSAKRRALSFSTQYNCDNKCKI